MDVSKDSQFSPQINKTEIEYHLSAKVWIIDTYAKQGIQGGMEKVKAVGLVIQDGDERGRFFSAWLPDDNDHIVEVLCEFGDPIFGVARLCVRRADKNYPHGPYLFVMHKWLEDILNKKPFHVVRFKTRKGSEDAQDLHESDGRDTNTEVNKL